MKLNKKGFSMIEIMIAGSLSLLLGMLVSVTITNSTNTLKQNNAVISSDTKAREFNSYIQKYLSSADKRSFCENKNPLTGDCLIINKNVDDPTIINYSITNTSESISFYSYYCDNRINNLDCSNNDLSNPSEVKISYLETPGNPSTNSLIICKKIPSNTSGTKSLVTDLSKMDMTPTNSPSTMDPTCTSPNLKKVYSIEGVSKYSVGAKVFNLIGADGNQLNCVSTVPSEVFDPACLQQIETIRVNAKFDWEQSNIRTKINRKRFNEKTSKVELYISMSGKQ